MLILREALAVVCKDADIRDVKALIIGPPNTPYQFGFFEVLPCNIGMESEDMLINGHRHQVWN
jgi:hypothetical protein